jgi:hypothetical protein
VTGLRISGSANDFPHIPFTGQDAKDDNNSLAIRFSAFAEIFRVKLFELLG